MNKVVTINLNGAAYQLEEGGYDALRAYLDSASRRLEANPDRTEIVTDIEQAIADKFRALLSAHKNVISAAEVTRIVTEMGPIEDSSTPAEAGAAGGAAPAGTAPAPGPASAGMPLGGGGVKRIYRIQEGGMIAGVCNGVAAYLNLDATIVRIVLVLLALLSVLHNPNLAVLVLGAFTWTLIYGVLALVIPPALTPEQQNMAHGGHDAPKTAQEFIRRAREGYYEGMKTWHDKNARREWKRKFKNDLRGWKRGFQQEMHRTGEHWSASWHRAAAQPLPAAHGPSTLAAAWVFLPIIALLHVALVGIWLLALISWINTGAVFGVVVMSGLPLWEGILILALVYAVLSTPLRIVRHGFLGYWHHRGHYPHPVTAFCDALVWVGIVALVAWVATHHHGEVRHALEQIPGQVRQGLHSIRAWIHGHT